MSNPYESGQHVYIKDPSGRLGSSGITEFHFPYTPTITSISSANYSSYDPTHSNFQQRAFEMSANTELTIAAPIVIENEIEARTILRAMQFFRGAMKMNFGKNDDSRGLPPPILRFYANNVYQNVPVLIRDFTYNMDADVDYIEFGDGGGEDSAGDMHRLPVVSNFVLSLTTTYSPKNVRENFTLQKYLNGSLRSDGYV